METESLIKEKEPHMEKTDEDTTDKKIEFWGPNPNALFDPSSILQLFPVADLSYDFPFLSIFFHGNHYFRSHLGIAL